VTHSIKAHDSNVRKVTTQAGDTVLGYVTWKRRVTMEHVQKRIAFGCLHKDPPRRELIKNFKEAMRIYNLTCYEHDTAAKADKAKNVQKRKRADS
jgi:hypothetical protein